VNDDVASGNLERNLYDIRLVKHAEFENSYQNCFEHEEVPAGCKAHSFVHVATSESDEGG